MANASQDLEPRDSGSATDQGKFAALATGDAILNVVNTGRGH